MAEQGGQTRRQLLKGAIGGAAGLVLSAAARPLHAASAQAAAVQALPASAASGEAAIQRLADDLFIITVPGEANVVAHTTSDGVVLVDGASARASDALMKAVATLPGGRPVETIFNTHWHPEQVGSNERLGAAGKTIIAHENTRLWLTTDVTWPWNGQRFKRLPKQAQPNKTIYTTGQLGPKERREGVPADAVAHFGYVPEAAHTDGDLYVYFPRQNVLAVGDVVSGQGWPVVDYITGGWIGGMVGGIQRLQTLANDGTRIVPARGPVLGPKDLAAQYDMYSKIYERLTQLLNKGRGPTEAVEARPTKEFDAQMGNPDEFVRRAFESLWAYLSPDA